MYNLTSNFYLESRNRKRMEPVFCVLGRGGISASLFATLLEKLPLPPNCRKILYSCTQCQWKWHFTDFLFKNRDLIIHCRLVHFNPRPNLPWTTLIAWRFYGSASHFYHDKICSGMNGLSPNYMERCLEVWLFHLNHLHISFHLNRKCKFFIHREGSAFKMDMA